MDQSFKRIRLLRRPAAPVVHEPLHARFAGVRQRSADFELDFYDRRDCRHRRADVSAPLLTHKRRRCDSLRAVRQYRLHGVSGE